MFRQHSISYVIIVCDGLFHLFFYSMHICIDLSLTAIVYYFANHLVPNANVSVTALDDNPTIGESFSIECNVTIAKSIIGSVDIIWTVNDTIKRRVNDSVGDTSSYRDVYNITALQLSDDNTVYVCEAVVNMSVLLKDNDSITIMLKYGKCTYMYNLL